MSKKALKFFRYNLIAGMIVILPVTITAFVIRFFVISLNAIMLDPFTRWLKPYPLYEGQRLFLAKTLVFTAVILLITMAGLMTRILVLRQFFSFFENILLKLPMINKIYSSIKQISGALFDKKKGALKKVVLIEYPRKGLYALGFITSEHAPAMEISVGENNLVSVYVPTTPNPTSGYFVLLKKEDIHPVDMSIEDALKVIISAGAISPAHLHKPLPADPA
ncbi:MAG: DUF502 domain-containing protein [Candidatus Omnitrophota bacterium]|jgi:uncharacterized membrane protein